MAKITKVSILRNGTRKPVVPMEDINRTAGIVQYDSTNDLLKVDKDLEIDSLEVTGNAEIDGALEVHKNIKADEDILTHGDLEVKGAAEFRNDVAIAGDLYVDGQEHINDSETVQTTGDYFILRHNNNVPLGHGEKSGIAVFNYKTNRTATATVDEDGTWRIADNTATSTIHNNLYYFDGHYYDTSFVEQVFVDQIKTAFDEDEIANCVFYNSNSFYHYDGTSWFAVTLEDNHLITDETEVTDPTLIAALELLDKGDLQYFRRLQITQISEIENEPILTRDEEANLPDNAILKWDADATKAVAVDMPVQNNTVLTAKVNAGADYHWQAITFTATGYAQMLYDFPANDDTVFMDLTLKQGTKPTPVPSEATTVSHNYTDFLYYTETDKIVSYDADADKYYEVFFNKDGTCWVDTSPTVVGDPTALVTCTIYSEKIDNVHGTSYEWKSGGSGSVSRFATMADAQAALAIPEGSDGYIPNNGIVIVDELDAYIKGDEQ